MPDLIGFLRARLDEDERIATAAPRGHHQIHAGDIVGTVNPDCPDCVTPYRRGRMLVEVEAKRRIIDRHTRCDDWGFGDPTTCPELMALVQVYADHPDFEPEWKVTTSV